MPIFKAEKKKIWRITRYKTIIVDSEKREENAKEFKRKEYSMRKIK
jgi:hypothetical protein